MGMSLGADKRIAEAGGLCYDVGAMKFFALLSVVLFSAVFAWAEGEEKGNMQQQAELLHAALRGYGVMILEVHDTGAGQMSCYALTHEQEEEMAQALIMLQPAGEVQEKLACPQYRLKIYGYEGEQFEFDLSLIVPADEPPANYVLPVVEYERMRGVLEELEENAHAGKK